MSGLSLHAVDVATGRPAAGLRVEVHGLSPGRKLLADGILGASGALAHPIAATRLAPGPYEVLFHLGAWLGPERGGILDVVPFRFVLSDPGQHIHLPLKFTPWGYSIFRGS